MNRRGFLRGTISVMALAAVLRGREPEHSIIGIDLAKGVDMSSIWHKRDGKWHHYIATSDGQAFVDGVRVRV